MVFGWDRKVVGISDQEDITVEDLEELLDIIEDFFEAKVVSFELCEFQGDAANMREYSHSVLVKFKNSKKYSGEEKGLIVGHVRSKESKNHTNTLRFSKNMF